MHWLTGGGLVSRQAFRGKWDKEVDHSYPLDDLEGIVDASILKKAPPKAQHPYGMLRLRLSFAATEFGSDDEFSDEDTADVEMAAAEGSEEEGTSSSEDELRARCAPQPSLALFRLLVGVGFANHMPLVGVIFAG